MRGTPLMIGSYRIISSTAAGDELGTGAKQRELVGVRGEEEQHDRERAAGRVVARERTG